MNNIVDLLFNAASGGVVGSALHLVTDWVDTKNKISLLKAQTDSAEKVEAWKAFSAAQTSNAPFVVPANTPAWAAGLYTLVAALKDVTRPLLTWAATIIVAMVFLKSTPAARETIMNEILFGCFTAWFFWFGSRYTRK